MCRAEPVFGHPLERAFIPVEISEVKHDIPIDLFAAVYSLIVTEQSVRLGDYVECSLTRSSSSIGVSGR